MSVLCRTADGLGSGTNPRLAPAQCKPAQALEANSYRGKQDPERMQSTGLPSRMASRMGQVHTRSLLWARPDPPGIDSGLCLSLTLLSMLLQGNWPCWCPEVFHPRIGCASTSAGAAQAEHRPRRDRHHRCAGFFVVCRCVRIEGGGGPLRACLSPHALQARHLWSTLTV